MIDQCTFRTKDKKISLNVYDKLSLSVEKPLLNYLEIIFVGFTVKRGKIKKTLIDSYAGAFHIHEWRMFHLNSLRYKSIPLVASGNWKRRKKSLEECCEGSNLHKCKKDAVTKDYFLSLFYLDRNALGYWFSWCHTIQAEWIPGQ